MGLPRWNASAERGSATTTPRAIGTPKAYRTWTSGKRTNRSDAPPALAAYETFHGTSADSHVRRTASSPAYSDRTHITVLDVEPRHKTRRHG